MKFWIVCYDVRDDKRRNKLAKLIEQRCERVQYSVFECPLSQRELDRVLPRWLAVLDLKEDSLRAYPLDEVTKGKVRIYGSPGLYEPPDFLIL